MNKLLTSIAVVGALMSGAAYAGPSDVQVVKGTCDSSSHTAEGPLGADLTKRQSRFYCDSAVITFFDDYKGHMMLQFAQRESHHSPILGFAGRVEDNGIMMPVDHVYLAPGQATTVSDGLCKFFFKDRHMSGIVCGIKVDETGRRTTAVVTFTPGSSDLSASPATAPSARTP
jgi:hypothetical protein